MNPSKSIAKLILNGLRTKAQDPIEQHIDPGILATLRAAEASGRELLAVLGGPVQ